PASAGAAPGGDNDRGDLHGVSIGQMRTPRNHPRGHHGGAKTAGNAPQYRLINRQKPKTAAASRRRAIAKRALRA
ncbi:MAG: hypothetical protein ACO3BE_10425, partial [Gemmobacter sp.]